MSRIVIFTCYPHIEKGCSLAKMQPVSETRPVPNSREGPHTGPNVVQRSPGGPTRAYHSSCEEARKEPVPAVPAFRDAKLERKAEKIQRISLLRLDNYVKFPAPAGQ